MSIDKGLLREAPVTLLHARQQGFGSSGKGPNSVHFQSWSCRSGHPYLRMDTWRTNYAERRLMSSDVIRS